MFHAEILVFPPGSALTSVGLELPSIDAEGDTTGAVRTDRMIDGKPTASKSLVEQGRVGLIGNATALKGQIVPVPFGTIGTGPDVGLIQLNAGATHVPNPLSFRVQWR